jgi:tryptophanyl-tRNA synthetase
LIRAFRQALRKHRIVFGEAHECNEAAAMGVITDREICCHGAGGIDVACDRLVRDFASEFIDDALLQRIEMLRGAPAHPFLKCGLFCAHRSMHELLDAYEKGEGFYLYTGRGPSADMHIGHLVPFLFTAYLQRVFKVPCIIQLTDDEKFLYKGLSFEECQGYLEANVRDIIACGFDLAQTYIFSNFSQMGYLYPFVCNVQRRLTCNQVRATFGIDGSDSPAKMAFPAIQIVPALGSTFAKSLFSGKRLRCLVPCGIDQDPYFRLTRDLAHRMGEFKPAVLQSKFLPSLAGTHTKMSSSGATTILLSDSPQLIRKKINKAFSGGRATLAEHRRLGAELSVDVPLRYLHCFSGLVDAGLDLDEVDTQYAQGELLSGDVKQLCAKVVSAVLQQHLSVRATVSDEDVAFVITRRQVL